VGERIAGWPVVLEALARSVSSARRLAIRASRDGAIDHCCRPSLAIIPTERSDVVGSGDGGIRGEGVARSCLRPSGLAVTAELVRPRACPAPAAGWRRHRLTAVA